MYEGSCFILLKQTGDFLVLGIQGTFGIVVSCSL